MTAAQGLFDAHGSVRASSALALASALATSVCATRATRAAAAAAARVERARGQTDGDDRDAGAGGDGKGAGLVSAGRVIDWETWLARAFVSVRDACRSFDFEHRSVGGFWENPCSHVRV